MKAMDKTSIRKSASSGRAIARGFVPGLSQAVSVTGATGSRSYPATHRSAAEALQGDWDRLGRDMRHAVGRTVPSAKR